MRFHPGGLLLCLYLSSELLLSIVGLSFIGDLLIELLRAFNLDLDSCFSLVSLLL